MRGKAKINKQLPTHCGITPAYAGKSPALRPEFAAAQDHPRLCGEKSFTCFCFNIMFGSPPPMRGKAHRRCTNVQQDRITPAYAGKSIFSDLIDANGRDHPRLCGEKIFSFSSNNLIIGSPPPMRGKGLTCRRFHRSHQDHPRLCGEKLLHVCYSSSCSGSPPPMRGKVKIFGTLLIMLKDHPRLCGEK